MSNNMEKRVTKAKKFDAVAIYFSGMDADISMQYLAEESLELNEEDIEIIMEVEKWEEKDGYAVRF